MYLFSQFWGDDERNAWSGEENTKRDTFVNLSDWPSVDLYQKVNVAGISISCAEKTSRLPDLLQVCKLKVGLDGLVKNWEICT